VRKVFLFFAVALLTSGCGGNATAASTAATAKTYNATADG